MPLTKTDRRVLFIYAIVAVAFFPRLFTGEVLCGGSNVYDQPPFASLAPADFKAYSHEVGGDVWRQHGTFQRYQHESGRAGRFPFWNPHSYLGAPFHANGQTALFHPWNAAYWVFDADSARGPLAMFRLWIGAATTYLLIRRWNVDVVPAFVGGAAWMFAQFNIRWLLWPPSNVSLWLPVLLWALDRLLEKPTLQRLAQASLAATVLQLSGHPETQFQAGVVAGVFVLIRLTTVERRWRGFFLSFAAIVLGTLGSAVQTLPFLHQLLGSVDWVEHSRGPGQHLPFEGLKMMLVPDCFGRPRAGHGYAGPSNYLECGCGFGAIALAAAFVGFLGFGLAAPLRRLSIGFAIAAFGFGGLAFGAPLISTMIGSLPLFDQLNPGRWLIGMELFGVLLAALGIQAVIGDRRSVLVFAAALASLLVASGVIILGSERATPTLIDDAFTEPIWRVVEQHPAIHAALGWMCTFAALTATVLLRQRGMTVVAAVIFAQGFFDGWDFAGTCPKRMMAPFDPPLLASARKHVGDGRIVGTEEVLSPNLGMLYGFRDVRGYDFPLDLRLAKAFKRLGWGWNGMTFVPRKNLIPAASADTAAFLERCAVWAVYSNLRLPELSMAGERWRQVADNPSADAVFLSPSPFPRVRFAESAKAGNAEEAFATLFKPIKESTVVLEGNVDASSLPKSANGAAKIVRDEPERIEISVETSTGGVVVLADRMSPGWTATIDGKPVVALTADYLFRGVAVPRGASVIVWTYSAPGFLVGCWIGALTVVLLLLAAVRFR